MPITRRQWWSSQAVGLVGLSLVAVSVAAAQGAVPVPSPLADWMGLSGVLAMVGFAVNWGRLIEYKKASAEKFAAIESNSKNYVQLDRWDDHRAEVARRQQELLDRVEGIHRSLQAVRRDQLERLHGMTDKEGGV